MKTSKNIADFLRFLKDHNAYMGYLSNISNKKCFECESRNRYYTPFDFLKNEDETLWLFRAFTWSQTEEGGDFWADLNDEWENYCINNKKH